MPDEIRYDVHDGVATITLNRPDRLNAITWPMYDDLLDIFDATDADDSVRAVVFTGAGRAFCAGADLGEGGSTFDYTPVDGAPVSDRGGDITLRIFRSLKPIIAAINGPAVGFGATVTLPMDFRMMSDGAKIGFVFGARGIAPEAASSWFLPRIVGVPTALEWCLTARLISPAEALSAGLARSIHPSADLLDSAYELAHEIASSVAPLSAVMIRQLIWQMSGAEHPMVAHSIDSAAMQSLGGLADAKEGIASFLEKRSPEWKLTPGNDLPDWFPWQQEPPYGTGLTTWNTPRR
jgi:enoyl-CoA hydratase/carnithine racemase